MKKIFLVLGFLILSLTGFSQQRPSVHFYKAGITYKANDLVSNNGIIYKALVQTVNVPPHVDWDVLESGEVYTFSTPLTLDGNNDVGIDQADTNTNGFISFTDWNTFNNKLSSESDPLWIASPSFNTTGTNTGDQDLSSLETKLNRIENATTYTPIATDVGKKIIMTGSSIVMDDTGLTVGYQNNILNNSGGAITWDFGTNAQTVVQSTVLDIADAKYAYIELIAANTWSVIVQTDAGGGGTVISLDDLSDATITTPASEEALIYDTGQWINRSYDYNYLLNRPTIPTDNTQLTNGAGYITSQTDSQTLTFTSPNLSISNGNSVDLSSLSVDLSDYETKMGRQMTVATDYTTALADVNKKIIMTGSTIILDDTGLLPGYQIQFLNRSGGLISVDYTTHTQQTVQPVIDIANTKYAYFELVANDLWSLVIGTDAQASGATTLAELTDTDITAPSNGASIVYNSTSGKWEDNVLGAGVSQLDELSDVTSAIATDRFALMANGTTYVGRAIVEADISDFGTYNNYTHPTGSGNYHLPSGGTIGDIIVNTASGTGTWQTHVLTDDQTDAEVSISAPINTIVSTDVHGALVELVNDISNISGGSGSTDLSWDLPTHTMQSNTGENATIPYVNTTYSGLMSPSMYQNHLANNAKATNYNHTGEVTGDTNLTISSSVVDSDNIVNNSIGEEDIYIDNTWFTDAFLTYTGAGNIFTWAIPAGQGTTYTAGIGLDLTGSVFSHEDNSTQTDVDNVGNFVVQDILLDQFGHIETINSKEITLAGLGWTAPPASDNYSGWDLYTDTTSRGRISSGENVDFLSGTNTTVSYSATNNSITYSSTDQYVGTVTEVLVSTGLDIASSTTTPTISVDFTEHSSALGNLVSTDYLMADNGSQNSRQLISSISLGIFDNSTTNFTSNTGDITAVNTTFPLTGGVTSGSATLGVSTAIVANGGTSLATGDQIYDFVIGQGYTSNAGDINGVIAGTGLAGGAVSGTAEVYIVEGSTIGGLTVNANTLELGPLNGNWDSGETYTITAAAFYEGSLSVLKTNIQPFIKSGLELINSLDIVSYDKKDGNVKDKVGILIDDSPEEFANGNHDAVDLYKTIFVQAKAIQELSDKIDELENRIKKLEND